MGGGTGTRDANRDGGAFRESERDVVVVVTRLVRTVIVTLVSTSMLLLFVIGIVVFVGLAFVALAA